MELGLLDEKLGIDCTCGLAARGVFWCGPRAHSAPYSTRRTMWCVVRNEQYGSTTRELDVHQFKRRAGISWAL